MPVVTAADSAAEFEFSWQRIGDAESLWLKGRELSARKNRLTVVLPGNPGAVSAYGEFASALRQLLDTDVVVQGHPGHAPHSTSTYELQHAIAHHAKQLDRHAAAYGEIVLLGHSIGAYMAVRAHQSAPPSSQEKIAVVGSICGTLSRFAPRGYVWCTLVSSRTGKHLLSTLVRALPNRLKTWLAPDPQILAECESGRFFDNIITLLRSEFRALEPELPAETLLELRDKALLVYATDDIYVTRATQQQAASLLETVSPAVSSVSTSTKSSATSLAALPAAPLLNQVKDSIDSTRVPAAVYVSSMADLTHSFCLYPRESMACAREIKRMIAARGLLNVADDDQEIQEISASEKVAQSRWPAEVLRQAPVHE